MSTRASASRRRLGDFLVGLGGFRDAAEGWLWARITAAALCFRASLTTSRGWTVAPSMVPRKRSSAGDQAVAVVEVDHGEDFVIEVLSRRAAGSLR